jgi:hypothetical protein
MSEHEKTAESNEAGETGRGRSTERKKTPLELVRERRRKMRGQQASGGRSQGGGGAVSSRMAASDRCSSASQANGSAAGVDVQSGNIK